MSESMSSRSVAAGGELSDSRFNRSVRAALGLFGVVLIVTGVVTAFETDEGVATASIVAVGAVTLFVAYFAPYIEVVSYKGVEARLRAQESQVMNTIRETGEEAVDAVMLVKNQALEDVAHEYEDVRASMPSGGKRDVELAKALREGELRARAGELNSETVAEFFHQSEGGRVIALGAMKVDLNLRDFDLVVQGIRAPYHPFDQDRYLVLGADMIPDLTEEQRTELLRVVTAQQEPHGSIRRRYIRWLSAERVRRLLER